MTDSRRHLVESVDFSEGEVVCRCGWIGRSAPPEEELVRIFAEHRKAEGVGGGALSSYRRTDDSARFNFVLR